MLRRGVEGREHLVGDVHWVCVRAHSSVLLPAFVLPTMDSTGTAARPRRCRRFSRSSRGQAVPGYSGGRTLAVGRLRCGSAGRSWRVLVPPSHGGQSSVTGPPSGARFSSNFNVSKCVRAM